MPCAQIQAHLEPLGLTLRRSGCPRGPSNARGGGCSRATSLQEGQHGQIFLMVGTPLTIAIGHDLPNSAYAALVGGSKGCCMSPDSVHIRRWRSTPDCHITDAKAHAAYDEAAMVRPVGTVNREPRLARDRFHAPMTGVNEFCCRVGCPGLVARRRPASARGSVRPGRWSSIPVGAVGRRGWRYPGGCSPHRRLRVRETW